MSMFSALRTSVQSGIASLGPMATQIYHNSVVPVFKGANVSDSVKSLKGYCWRLFQGDRLSRQEVFDAAIRYLHTGTTVNELFNQFRGDQGALIDAIRSLSGLTNSIRDISAKVLKKMADPKYCLSTRDKIELGADILAILVFIPGQQLNAISPKLYKTIHGSSLFLNLSVKCYVADEIRTWCKSKLAKKL